MKTLQKLSLTIVVVLALLAGADAVAAQGCTFGAPHGGDKPLEPTSAAPTGRTDAVEIVVQSDVGVLEIEAQDGADTDIALPDWFNNLTLAGLALAPVTVAVVQVIKVIGARLGLPEGYSGYITLVVSVVMVAVALGAGVFKVEAQVAEALTVVHRVAETMLVLLGALGWYAVGKKAQIITPVRWQSGQNRMAA